MGIVISLLLIAVGAVLKFAITADLPSWDLQATGVILMIVGGIGVILSVIFWSTWGGFSRRVTESTAPRHERIVRADRDIDIR
jgi:hypothetical protein